MYLETLYRPLSIYSHFLFHIFTLSHHKLKKNQKPSNKFWSVSAIDNVVPLDADTCSKLLTSTWSFFTSGFQGTLHFLKLFQSTFRNHGWIRIYLPSSFAPNLFDGLGFNKDRIKCLALRPKKSGNSKTPFNIFLYIRLGSSLS